MLLNYHYTSIEGLKGIIENKCVRFTDCQFLNDTSEYNHLKMLLKKIQEGCGCDDEYNHFLGEVIS